MKCNRCKSIMTKEDRRNEMADIDDDVSDGQLGDYLAAELSGDNGEWNIGIVEYVCPKCNAVNQLISENLRSYNPLIKAWHEKAIGEDYFSGFVFEYLAFIAHIKNNLFYKEQSDRGAIQRLKQADYLRDEYLFQIDNNKELHESWEKVIAELTNRPLYNNSKDQDNPEIDKWWNSHSINPNPEDDKKRGYIFDVNDWDNMVEFWCAVRNNLFHGGKDPNIKRDIFLVEHAYKTLSIFVELQIKNSIND